MQFLYFNMMCGQREMIDFNRTHRIRRDISQDLQQSQKSESHAAELSAKVAVNCKGDLLIFLSAWLLELNSANVLTGAEREEVQSLTQMPLDKWIQLQATAVQNEKNLKEAESKEKEAIALRNKKAPFGAATKVFADAESKRQIKVLQDNVAAAQKHHASASDAVQKNVAERQRLGEMFFRDCLGRWDKLALTRALGKEAGVILNHMTQKTNALWVEHRKQQAGEIDRIAKLLEDLRESYKDTPASLHHPRKVPSPQEQSEVHLGQGNSYDFTE